MICVYLEYVLLFIATKKALNTGSLWWIILDICPLCNYVVHSSTGWKDQSILNNISNNNNSNNNNNNNNSNNYNFGLKDISFNPYLYSNLSIYILLFLHPLLISLYLSLYLSLSLSLSLSPLSLSLPLSFHVSLSIYVSVLNTKKIMLPI